MQKNTLFSQFFRFVAHGVIAGVTAIALFVLGLGFLQVLAQDTSGGKFGELLNNILASGKWNDTRQSGTVKNAEKLGGKTASEFIQVKAGQSCASGQCVAGFQNDGTLICK